VALVPASLLPFKREWQAVANGLPKGSVLQCSTTSARQKKILEQVSAHLKRKGHRVRTLPAERFTEPEDKIRAERPSGASPRFVLVSQCAR
jgi:hypothetical protein